jgi:hypothetical protein
MFEAQRVWLSKQQFGFRYPPRFMSIAQELEAVAATASFASAFPDGKLVRPEDLAAVWAGRCPPTLVPFMCQGNLEFSDYYCFHKTQSGSGLPVVVFADHAVVFEWVDYEGFLNWLRQQCTGSNSEQTL